MATEDNETGAALPAPAGSSVSDTRLRDERRRRHRRSSSGSRFRTIVLGVTATLLGFSIVGAPLACGAVHRPVVFVVLGLSPAVGLLAAALAYRNKAELKPHVAMAIPTLFLLIAALQIAPIPWGLRARIDPAGSDLLALVPLHGPQPLSLDPPATYLEFAKAAAALCVGLAALVLSAGRRFRFVSIGLVACGGVAALLVGLGHRAISEDKIYGMFSTSRGLPVGPFINPNHSAEFLELGAFAALAFAFSRSSRDGQRVWKVVAALLAAGALSALSRGSVLAFGAGALTWFLLAPKSDEGEPLHRTRFAGMLIGLIVVVGVAVGFGAEDLVRRFTQSSAGSEPRFSLWWDALKIIRVHPAGVGLGAFGRVYPAYRSRPSPLWFQFPEDQPLGFLIEAGIPGALLMLACGALVIRHFAKNARRDRVEASLVAALAAVLAHNLTDFGLEALGVLLPFCATLGTIFGRQATVPDDSVGQSSATIFSLGSVAATLAAIALLLSPVTRNFDGLLAVPGSTARATAHAASIAHPTDYLYALAEAKLESTALASASLRLRMLNRAIILCPSCTDAHTEAARDLWRLGRRQQALLEWRTVLGTSPGRLAAIFAELAHGGAKAAELASLADDHNRYELSRLLLGSGMIDTSRVVLAGANDHDGIDFQLAQAQIAIAAGDLRAAQKASEAALALAPSDPSAVLLACDLALRSNDRDKAIELLQNGIRADPAQVDLNRKLLALLTQTDKWQAIDRALGGLRMALAASGAPMTEANLAAASIYERQGHFHRAVSEYRAALAQNPGDLGLQLALARAAEQSGSVTVAIDAYDAVLRHEPDNAEAHAALIRIQRDKKLLEVFGTQPPHTRADDM